MIYGILEGCRVPEYSVEYGQDPVDLVQGKYKSEQRSELSRGRRVGDDEYERRVRTRRNEVLK